MVYPQALPRQITGCKIIFWCLHPQLLLENNLSNLKIGCRPDIRIGGTAKYSVTNRSLLREAGNPLDMKGECHQVAKNKSGFWQMEKHNWALIFSGVSPQGPQT